MTSLLVISQLGGLAVMLFVLYLLYRGRIFINTVTNEVVEFSLPFRLRVRTQTPVVMMLLLGVTMVLVPLWSIYHPRMVELKGDVNTGGRPVVIALIAQPDYSISHHGSGKFARWVPILPGETYNPYFLLDDRFIEGDPIEIKGSSADMGRINLQIPAPLISQTKPGEE